MEFKQHKQSVIARLMGLDETPPQQTVNKQQRVLSEDYFRKSASIGLREGSSFHRGKNVSGTRVLNHKHNILSAVDKEVNLNTSKTQLGTRTTLSSVTNLNSVPVRNCNYQEFCHKKYKQHSRRNVLRPLQKFENDSLTGPFEKLGFNRTDKLKSQLVRIEQLNPFSISIIELEPNSKMAKSDSRYKKSDDLLPRSGGREHGGSLVPGKEKIVDEYKEQAVRIRMSRLDRHGISNREASTLQLSGDNYLRSDWDSWASCTGFFRRKGKKISPYPFPDESSSARQPKKQIFEQQKRTKKAQEVESAGSGQNLGKMLVMSDWESTLENLNLELGKHCLCNPSSLQGGILESSCASGISRNDGWKNQNVTGLQTSKVEVLNETFSNGFLLRQEEAHSSEENKSRKQKIFHKDNSLENEGLTCGEQFQSCPGISDNNNPIEYESGTLAIQDELVNSLQYIDIDQNSTISNSNICNHDFQSTVDILPNPEEENKEITSGVYKQRQSELNPAIFIVQDRQSSFHVKETLTGQYCSDSSHDWKAMVGQVSSSEFPEEESFSPDSLRLRPPEMHMNLKETHLHSPDSILEPFEEENCLTSEYYESVTTDFNSQQLQLQFLKFESEECSEGSGMAAVSSNSDTENGSCERTDDGENQMKLFGNEESRDFSYMVDVLDEARFNGLQLEMDFEAWHSLECPVSPSIFEKLEKKYGKQTSWEKLQRQLLFDRINTGLRDIISPPKNFRPSVHLTRRFSAKLTWEEVAEQSWILLISQEKQESKELYEKALEKENKWFDLEDDIDIICQELQIHLFDDLVMEMVQLENMK